MSNNPTRRSNITDNSPPYHQEKKEDDAKSTGVCSLPETNVLTELEEVILEKYKNYRKNLDTTSSSTYRKMLKMGIPELAVKNKMRINGVEERLINIILSSSEDQQSSASMSDATESIKHRNESNKNLSEEDELLLSKYIRLKKMQVPRGAILQKMILQNIDERLIRVVLNESTGVCSPQNINTLTESEEAILEKYKHYRKNRPEEAILEKDESELSARCAEAISRLTELKINFLALDFDLTIIDIHTGGVWNGTASELATHVRPVFRNLVKEAVNAGIKVAVVTFSPQIGHIKEILKLTFPNLADSIPIRGMDRSWSYDGIGSKEGKQSHMASAMEELEAHHPGMEISKNTTLLIDDDVNNIKIALRDGVHAIWFKPNNSLRVLEGMRMLT